MTELQNEPILKSMEAIYEERDDLIKKNKLEDLDPAIQQVNKFLDCESIVGIICSIAICKTIAEDDFFTLRGIGKTIGIQTSTLSRLPDIFDSFFETGLLRLHDISPLGRFSVSQAVINAVLCNDKEQLFGEFIKDPFSFIQHFNDLVGDRGTFKNQLNESFSWVKQQISMHTHIRFVNWVRKQQLSPAETIALLYLFARFLEGESDVGVGNMIGRVFDNLKDQHTIRYELRQQKSRLIKLKLVLTENMSNPFFDTIRLSPKAIKALCGDSVELRKGPLDLQYCDFIPANQICKKKLVYSIDEQQELEKLFALVKQNAFVKAQRKMKEEGLPEGITVMLHGYPGTGKTETVNQLALASGRSILMAEISKIRSKWVGDSEKNIKGIFDEYRQVMKKEKLCPILLFNEADGILGKRRDPGSAVDQMNNNMQNILLQELETFEGLFIATTNLISNLDFAFERRLLYKIEFHKPGPESRMQIWMEKFPQLDRVSIQRLSRQFELSGGQIENIRKKMILENVLSHDFVPDEDLLFKCAEQELVMNKPCQPLIGFNRTSVN